MIRRLTVTIIALLALGTVLCSCESTQAVAPAPEKKAEQTDKKTAEAKKQTEEEAKREKEKNRRKLTEAEKQAMRDADLWIPEE